MVCGDAAMQMFAGIAWMQAGMRGYPRKLSYSGWCLEESIEI